MDNLKKKKKKLREEGGGGEWWGVLGKNKYNADGVELGVDEMSTGI